MTRVALDTNILAYAEGLVSAPTDLLKIDKARALLRALIADPAAPVIAAQVLAELHRLLTRKARLSPAEANLRLSRLAAVAELIPTTAQTLQSAFSLAEAHGLQTFDAVILACAAEARCDFLVSEDMHDGFSWRGVAVCNPFGPAPDPRVTRLLPP